MTRERSHAVGIFGRRKRQQQSVQEEVAATPDTPDHPLVRGPKDRADVPGVEGRVDLGAIWLRGVPGMQLRLETDPARQKVIGAHLVLAGSQVQVQAYAAPRSAGIWDEIRDELAQGLATGGGTAEEVEGPFGVELHGRMPTRLPDGRTDFSPVRFIGVDGPRWFFRAVMSGRAAVDDAAAEQFYSLIEDMVVVRGEVPMPPREVLPLSMPAAAPTEEDAEDAEGGESLDPFTRGPEITEIR